MISQITCTLAVCLNCAQSVQLQASDNKTTIQTFVAKYLHRFPEVATRFREAQIDPHAFFLHSHNGMFIGSRRFWNTYMEQTVTMISGVFCKRRLRQLQSSTKPAYKGWQRV